MAILQKTLPYTPWADPRMSRLPGIQPLDPADWLVVDEAYALQMAERERLFAEAPDKVHALDPAALPAARELLDTVLSHLAARGDFEVGKAAVTRPDGVRVALDRDAPLLTAGRLVQEDLCLMERPDGAEEHILTGAALCFPASWTLAEKFMRPLIRIHRPVAPYDADVARRVQRLFDALAPGRALWRANAHFYEDPALHQPRPEAAPRRQAEAPTPYMRSERQCLLRLPRTRAVVFSIHTYVVHVADLTEAQKAALDERPAAQG
ncbi:MAG: heme-dependent oxidative N-demethylase family protein [Paracoccaceae bacterium]